MLIVVLFHWSTLVSYISAIHDTRVYIRELNLAGPPSARTDLHGTDDAVPIFKYTNCFRITSNALFLTGFPCPSLFITVVRDNGFTFEHRRVNDFSANVTNVNGFF